MRWFILAATVVLTVVTTVVLLYGFRHLTVVSHSLAEPVEIVVEHGDTLTAVAYKLESTGVVQNGKIFEWYTRYNENGDQIKAGEYRFEESVSVATVLEQLLQGSVITYSLQLREGARFDEYLDLLKSNPKLVNDLEDISAENVVERLQLATIALHGEGLFFPETYQYRRGEAASSVLRQAYYLMEQELDHAWQRSSAEVNVNSKYELLIVASMVEKESHVGEDRSRISGVIHRRLGLDMYLQIDPTVIYALGDEFDGRLSRRDLRIDHSHNTYRTKGLPPTPICAPSREALSAAARPTPGNDLYFVSRGDGSSEFSATLTEHNRAVARYRRKR